MKSTKNWDGLLGGRIDRRCVQDVFGLMEEQHNFKSLQRALEAAAGGRCLSKGQWKDMVPWRSLGRGEDDHMLWPGEIIRSQYVSTICTSSNGKR